MVDTLYKEGMQSLMVEGGLQKPIKAFLEAQLWDEIHLEMAPLMVGGGTKAPELPHNAF